MVYIYNDNAIEYKQSNSSKFFTEAAAFPGKPKTLFEFWLQNFY